MEPVTMSFGAAIARYLFFAFNLLFFLIGLLLIGLGGYLQFFLFHFDVNPFVENMSLILPMLLIGVGFTLSLIAFFGCCGAAKNTYHRFLFVYAGLVGFLFVLEITTAAVSYVNRDDIHKTIETNLEYLMNDYKNSSVAKNVMDEIQYDFYCCGAKGPEDYLTRQIIFPRGCCPDYHHPIPDGCPLDAVSKTGCADIVIPFILHFSIIFASIGGFVLFLQIFGIVSALLIARSISRGYQKLQS